MALRSIEVCAGVGGLAFGLRRWARTVCYVERDPYAVAVLATRMRAGDIDAAPIWDDVTTFDGRPWRGCVDIIAGGIPCQIASQAGLRKGADDERNMGLSSEPSSVTFPKTGIMLRGRVSPLLLSAPSIDASASSSSDGWPTPLAKVSPRSRASHPSSKPGQTENLSHAAKLWPTPDASAANDTESLPTWLARREREASRGNNGNGMGTPLAVAVRLWPTATAKDADMSGCAHLTTESGCHSGTMWATPMARDARGAQGPNYHRAGGPSLPTQAQWATPTARDEKTKGGRDLPTDVGAKPRTALNPAWTSCLVGLGPSWTLLDPESVNMFGNLRALSRAASRTARRNSDASETSASPSKRKRRSRSSLTSPSASTKPTT